MAAARSAAPTATTVADYYSLYFPSALVTKFYEIEGPWSHREVSIGQRHRMAALGGAQQIAAELARRARTGGKSPVGDYHVGAIGNIPYEANARGARAQSNPWYPQSRSLVFDIDITEDYYADRGHCGCLVASDSSEVAESDASGSAATPKKYRLCEQCWRALGWLSVLCYGACKDLFYTEANATRAPLCVYTGGRGCHVYVPLTGVLGMSDACRDFVARAIERRAAAILASDFDMAACIDADGIVLDPLHPLTLDRGVTASAGHLSRGLFSIHGGTGALALPIDPDRLLQCSSPSEMRVAPVELANPLSAGTKVFNASVEFMRQWLASNAGSEQ